VVFLAQRRIEDVVGAEAELIHLHQNPSLFQVRGCGQVASAHLRAAHVRSVDGEFPGALSVGHDRVSPVEAVGL
jgi:hypothetical protein